MTDDDAREFIEELIENQKESQSNHLDDFLQEYEETIGKIKALPPETAEHPKIDIPTQHPETKPIILDTFEFIPVSSPQKSNPFNRKAS